MGFFSKEMLGEVSEYIEDLRAQDDRSCVIMIAARLEFLLRQAIEKRLLERRSKSKDSIEHLPFPVVSRCATVWASFIGRTLMRWMRWGRSGTRRHISTNLWRCQTKNTDNSSRCFLPLGKWTVRIRTSTGCTGRS